MTRLLATEAAAIVSLFVFGCALFIGLYVGV